MTTEHSSEALAEYPDVDMLRDIKRTAFVRGMQVARETHLTADRETVEKAVEAELTRGGFVLWLLSSGGSGLWKDRTPEQEIARVTTEAAFASAVFESREPLTAQRERAVEVAERFYDRFAGPGEQWTFADLFDYLVSEGVFTEPRESTAELQAQALEGFANHIRAKVNERIGWGAGNVVADWAIDYAARLRAGGEQHGE